MKNKFKIYVFIYTGKDSIYSTTQYEIYAWTDNKDYAERFASTRNMKYFFMKKVKLSLQERNRLIKDHMMCELSEFEGNTQLELGKKVKKFSIVLTKREKQSIMLERGLAINEYIFTAVWDDCNYLKDSIQEALQRLLYFDFQKYLLYGENEVTSNAMKKVKVNDMNIILKNIGSLLLEDKL